MSRHETSWRRCAIALAAGALLLEAAAPGGRAIASPGEPANAGDDALRARIDRRVDAWQPTKAERQFDAIGWAPDLRAALRLAREHGRPVFLFTYDGSRDRPNAIALQRC